MNVYLCIDGCKTTYITMIVNVGRRTAETVSFGCVDSYPCTNSFVLTITEDGDDSGWSRRSVRPVVTTPLRPTVSAGDRPALRPPFRVALAVCVRRNRRERLLSSTPPTVVGVLRETDGLTARTRHLSAIGAHEPAVALGYRDSVLDDCTPTDVARLYHSHLFLQIII